MIYSVVQDQDGKWCAYEGDATPPNTSGFVYNSVDALQSGTVINVVSSYGIDMKEFENLISKAKPYEADKAEKKSKKK